MRVHLGGHLGWYSLHKQSWLDVPVSEPISLIELARRLELPIGEIALAVVNGRAVSLSDTLVSDADRVELHPPIGGGSN